MTSRAVTVNERVLLCPLLQRCDAREVLRHSQLLPRPQPLLRRHGNAAEGHAHDRVIEIWGALSFQGQTWPLDK
jgi:hypothetical protein